MIPEPLLEILKPAYNPCAHLEGACAGACVWEPARGLVPCGYGGATGTLDEVQLIIVTAEPGDPPDTTDYHGTPTDMVDNSLRIFLSAMHGGGIERVGRPSPFHRSMRRILDAFWPNDTLEVQLRKTWATNAVLCPAKFSGGKHPTPVEKTCTATYLARPLNLFPKAFVLALGSKARDRMKSAGLRFDAVGLHPSARPLKAEKMKSWKRAAQLFIGEVSTGQAPSLSFGQSPGNPPLSTQDTVSHMSETDLHIAINDLPAEASHFFLRLIDHPDYECKAGQMQLKVSFRGKKIGGFNRKERHWYFSKVFIRDHGNSQTMSEHGFKHVVHGDTHQYWMRRGTGACAAFEEAMVAITRVRP